MSTHNTSAALRKCRGCGKVYAEDAPHPCTGGSDPYTAGMTIEEARRIYGSTDGKSPGVKAAEEADRVQLVEALAEHPGTPWGEAIEKVAALRAEHAAWAAVIDGLRATVMEMKAQRDADVMTALMRQSEASDVTLATVTRERDEARELLRRVLDVERIDAHRAGATGCRCMMRSRAAERAYEMGQCPHQLADTALAGAKS